MASVDLGWEVKSKQLAHKIYQNILGISGFIFWLDAYLLIYSISWNNFLGFVRVVNLGWLRTLEKSNFLMYFLHKLLQVSGE